MPRVGSGQCWPDPGSGDWQAHMGPAPTPTSPSLTSAGPWAVALLSGEASLKGGPAQWGRWRAWDTVSVSKGDGSFPLLPCCWLRAQPQGAVPPATWEGLFAVPLQPLFECPLQRQ